MVLQAFIGDSKEDGEVTVLAGYMAEAQGWVRFSGEWKQLLSIRPEWPRFKMSEVMWKGGDETLERAMFHYKAIERYVEVGFCVAVPHTPLSKVIREFGLGEKWNNPYYMAYIVLVSVMRRHMLLNRPNEPVELIFDTQLGEYRTVQDAWGAMVDRNRGDIRPFTGPPSFESDEEYLPLQAADLFAWHVRKKFSETGSITKDVRIFPWDVTSRGPKYLFSEIDEDGMRSHIRKSLNSPLKDNPFGPPLSMPGRSYLK